MLASFAHQLAAVFFQMSDQLTAFHS
jgi:hypothetical protein